MSQAQAVKLRILDKEVQLSCKSGEEDALAEAAAIVDKAMRDARSKNVSTSTEKLAIVTAINTTYSLIKERSGQQSDNTISKRLQSINDQLDSLLHDSA